MKTVLSLCAALFFFGCTDSSTGPYQENNPIAGNWEYSGEFGFTDEVDPENVFFPMYEFTYDKSFVRSAKYVELPSRRTIGYKYIQTGKYRISSDSIFMTVQNEIQLAFSDSLQYNPVPKEVPLSVRIAKYKMSEDTLRIIDVGNIISMYPPIYRIFIRKK